MMRLISSSLIDG